METNAAVVHLIKTACLVESRASQYGGYLARVFAQKGWSKTFERWGAEETTHGGVLRAWLRDAVPHFDFEATFARYQREVPYHDEEDESVYGSLQAELVTRCFTEAMAASYYQSVGAAAVEPSLKALCKRLAADEARHFTMFRRCLERLRAEEGPRRLEAWRVVWQRLRALSDEQIIVASWLARGAPGRFSHARELWWYRLTMARVYRPRQARFVGRLMREVLPVALPTT